jgi:DNA-binding transcriptional LysR family regulator
MPFCALMRVNHPLAARAKLFINECRDYPIVLAQEQLAARAMVDAALTADSAKAQPVLVTNMFEVMKKYVQLTDAISFHFFLASLGENLLDGLVAVPLADRQLAKSRLMLAVRRSRVLPARAAAICETLKSRLQDIAL